MSISHPDCLTHRGRRALAGLAAAYWLAACVSPDAEAPSFESLIVDEAHSVHDAFVPMPASLDAGTNVSGDPSSTTAAPIVLRAPLFFDLPINSVRYAVSGYDPATGLCISAIFMMHGPGDPRRYCDEFDRFMFPYIVLERASRAGCWHYGSAVKLESIRGCVDFTGVTSGAGEAQLTLTVTSELWSGTVIFDAPGTRAR
jgi:hypothetical protein